MAYRKQGGIPAPKPSTDQLPRMSPEPAPGQIVVSGSLRQEFAAKAVTDKLNDVLQQIADADGRVEDRFYGGGRDWIIFWSKPVTR
jgi:hypothetical protein